MKYMKIGKFTKIMSNKKIYQDVVILRNFANFVSFHLFYDFQLILTVLLTPTNFGFNDQVITSLLGVLGNKWWPLNIGIWFYWKKLRNRKLSFPQPGYQ